MNLAVATGSRTGQIVHGPAFAGVQAQLALLAMLTAGGCESPSTPQAPTPTTDPVPSSSVEPLVDRARELGIDFVQFNGMSGEYYFAEHMGSGGALLDYDNDGDLDVYLVQGSMLGPGKTMEDAWRPVAGESPPTDRLYRNDLDRTGKLGFTDVTAAAGIGSTDYGMGVAVGDFDRDGWVDFYVTGFGPNHLWRNNGDGSFTDVTERSRTGENRWSTSASFVDYDADGFLDLFVANYVDFTIANHKTCFTANSGRDYCGPLSYNPYPDRLFRNRGDGTFEDVTAVSQIARTYGAGLGVVCADFNGDQRVDIYVANDGMPNQLWINVGDGTFRENALMSGTAFNEEGKAEASMGVDAADFDGDGDEDLFMTHLVDETNTLYLNDGSGWFDDYSAETGLGVPSRSYTGFGTAWFDYDNDGWLDLIVANGAVKAIEELARAGDPYPLAQRNQLFRNLGDGRFDELTDRAGEAFALVEVSRGAAFGDVDNDGDTDVLIFNNSGPARLLINEVGNHNQWLGLRLTDADGKTDLLHTRVQIIRTDGSSLWRRVRVSGSYCSSSDPRVLVGLGTDESIRSALIHWPDGSVERADSLPLGRYTTLRKGTLEEVE